MAREEYLGKIAAKIRALIPDGTEYAEEKRSEVLAYAADEALGRPDIRNLAAAAGLPPAELERLWRRVDMIVDAH